jgi:hypothetical protein
MCNHKEGTNRRTQGAEALPGSDADLRFPLVVVDALLAFIQTVKARRRSRASGNGGSRIAPGASWPARRAWSDFDRFQHDIDRGIGPRAHYLVILAE